MLSIISTTRGTKNKKLRSMCEKFVKRGTDKRKKVTESRSNFVVKLTKRNILVNFFLKNKQAKSINNQEIFLCVERLFFFVSTLTSLSFFVGLRFLVCLCLLVCLFVCLFLRSIVIKATNALSGFQCS